MNPTYIGPIMKKISEEMERKANDELKKYRLTLTQGKVILFLSEQPEKTATQKDLENLLQVSHPTTVTIVKSMEAKKMIESFPHCEDKRMKNVRLIWGDDEIYKSLRENADYLDVQLTSGFSDEEKELFESFLIRAYKNAVK